jgi:hypothetical protein
MLGDLLLEPPGLVVRSSPLNARRAGGLGWLELVDANEVEIAERGP